MRTTCPWRVGILCATLSVSTALAEVVISELMYNPVDDADGAAGDPYEYVELYNAGAVPETLFSLSDGISYTFTNSPPVILNPGDYLLVVKDRAAFAARYPGVSNLADGAYSGKLANEGEKVTLKTSLTTNSLTYGSAGAWPAAANAFGPSLERYCLTASGSSSANWSASGAPTEWRQVVWTGQFATASIPLAFFLDFDGKCLIDDVSVKAVGLSEERVANGTFELGLTGWSVTNSHAMSRVESGVGFGGGAAMAVQCNESRWLVDGDPFSITFYGDASSNCVFSAPVDVVEGQDYEVSWRVRRIGHSDMDGLAGSIYCVMGGVTNALTLGSLGTPGRANSVSTDFLPLGITNVTQTYAICPTATVNTIQAQVSAPAEVSDVTLCYQVIATNAYRFTNLTYSNLVMRDDGAAPDLTAGDGSYAVNIPAVTSNWNLVRYHVVATATNGFQTQSPRLDDPSADYSYWVDSYSPQTNLPNWHVLVDGDPIVYPYSRHLCAISPDGQIFTDILAKHRGGLDRDNPQTTGIGLHFHRGYRYNSWFASNLKGINIRFRLNNVFYYYRRLVGEPLAYDLQRLIGLPTPRTRFICFWINGFPSITTELEKPDEPFLTGNGLSTKDYLTRQSSSDGIEYVAGDVTLDNFDSVWYDLNRLTSANRTEFIRTNFCYESIQHCLALVSITGNGDQNFTWNMFQHRAASDGRWRQYPWDVDASFSTTNASAWTSLTNLHPYYQTPLHPSMWNTNSSVPLGEALFYPETGDDTTLPYRYRQQTTLWRYCAGLLTTNYLFPRLDAIEATLQPAFIQINRYRNSGVSLNALSNEMRNVKAFIEARRDFLMNGDWSDKMAEIWAPTNIYNPSNVVVSEIMHSPVSGGKYIELFNRGRHAIDLSHWSLRSGSFSGCLPFGTMLAPTSFVVLVAAQTTLTNAYAELRDPAAMIERYAKTGIWDWPINFVSATEYASRVVQLSGLTVPSGGGTIELRNVVSNLIASVTYTNTPPWPAGSGVALELIDPDSTNTGGEAWRASSVVGTPGVLNTATSDMDADALPDTWEQQIIDASGGAFTSASQVLPGDDFDGDGLSNGDEFVLGSNPVSADPEWAQLAIGNAGGTVFVGFPTIPLTGSAYSFYSGRFYTLSSKTNLLDTLWNAVPAYSSLPAGGPIVFTNAAPLPFEVYRFGAALQPVRP